MSGSEVTTFTFYTFDPFNSAIEDYMSPAEVVNTGNFYYVNANIQGILTEQDVYNAWVPGAGGGAYQALVQVEIGTNVTSIGDNAFNSDPEYNWAGQGKNNVQNPLWVSTTTASGAVEQLPNMVSVLFKEGGPNFTSIGKYAFNKCYFLGANYCPLAGFVGGDVDAFNYNSGIDVPNVYINIPQTCQTIGDYAFANCYPVDNNEGLEYLTSVDSSTENFPPAGFPPSLMSIGSNAFEKWDFGTWYAMPPGSVEPTSTPVYINAETIGASAFINTTNWVGMNLGDKVTTIGANAFQGCDFTSLTIPASVKTIGDSAFKSCQKLNAVTFDESVSPSTCTSIGQSAFLSCPFNTIALPNSVPTSGLGTDVFQSSGLSTLNLTSGNNLGYSKDETNQTIGGKSGVDVKIVSKLKGTGSVITTGSIHTVNQGDSKTHTFSDDLVSNPPIHTMFHCAPLPRFANFNFDGNTGISKLLLKPLNADVGDHNVCIRHRHNPTGLIDEINYIIRIVNINDPPVFMSAPVRTARQESLYSYRVRTNDIDVGDLVTVTATTKPSWLSFDGTTLSGTPSRSVWGEYKVELLATDIIGGTATQSFTIMVRKPVCFNEGTKILCLKNGEEQYVAVEQLREGDEVKTMNHGYKKIADMRKGSFRLNGLRDMGMYKMKKQGNMIADLEMSGLHSVLVDANDAKYADDIKRQRGLNNKKFYIDGKFRLRANESHEFQKMEQNEYTIYSFALEEQQEQYGVWANGVLVETTKRKNLEVSNMKRIGQSIKGDEK